MRRSFLFVATAVITWAAVPSATTAIGVGSLVAATTLAASEASAGTAILPGWVHSCGRDPRCFERGEARRRARANARYMRSQ
jgi:hypothetical protein